MSHGGRVGKGEASAASAATHPDGVEYLYVTPELPLRVLSLSISYGHVWGRSSAGKRQPLL